jgi:dihydroorotate dehydrogenase (NAD+) catalytic subunit
MSVNLNVNIAGVNFKNPVIAASGTFGFGREYSDFFSLSQIGGISCKGTTLYKRDGNPSPRIAETPGGILNSVGLQNPGVDTFIEKELPWLSRQGTTVIANISGHSISDYQGAVLKVSCSSVDMVELNISCPNVKGGGMAFGTSCAAVFEVVSAVRAVCKKPLCVKLSPNVTDIKEIAKAAESAGADALSLINTLTGMRIDIETRRPVLKNNVGGLSGGAVFPVAVRMVSEVFRSVSIPVIGMGGISTGCEAIEMMLAGARAVQVGTAIFKDPLALVNIANEIEQWLNAHGIGDVNEIVGAARMW